MRHEGQRPCGRLAAATTALHQRYADLLFKLAAGKADPVASVLMGKLKVEGSIDKAMQIKTFLAAHRG